MTGIAVQVPGAARFVGRPGLVALLLKNLLLNIVTVGFYRFWARTRLRQFLWASVEILGDPLEYTGTGAELFRGFLRALVFLVPLGIVFAVSGLLFADNPVAYGISQAVIYIAFGLLYFLAVFLSRRYRLTRTVWRGVRFGQDGTAKGYAWRMAGWGLLGVLTLGLAAPWARTAQQRYLINHTLFGDRHFSFDARGIRLLAPWLLVYATLGIAYFWYRMREFRYFTSCTRLGQTGFSSTAQSRTIYGRLFLYFLVLLGVYLLLSVIGGAVFVMIAIKSKGMQTAQVGEQIKLLLAANIAYVAVAGALLAVLVSAVLQILAWFVLYLPILGRVLESVDIDNPGALDQVAQSTLAGPQLGEGLADAFDVGLA